MPVNDNLSWPHTTNKPHDNEGWDARRVLLDGQLTLVYATASDPNLCNDKLRCVGDFELESDENG